MDRPGGHGPSDARSTRAGDAVTVADMVMQRIVVPPYAGSNPVSHLQINPSFTYREGINTYENQSYYNEHPVMYLMTPTANYRIELFSGYTTEMDSSAYMQTFGSIRKHTDWLKEVSSRSDFRANLEISAYDRVITLSTCAYRFENARYVLHGKLVEFR